MRVLIILNKEGMLQTGFVSPKKAQDYLDKHPEFVMDSVDIDQSADPADEVGAPHKVALSMGIRVTRVIARSEEPLSPSEEAELVKEFVIEELIQAFGPETIINSGGWEVLDAGDRQIEHGN
jgi:hypothetical protein